MASTSYQRTLPLPQMETLNLNAVIREGWSAAMSTTENIFDSVVRGIRFLICTRCFGYGDDPNLLYIQRTYEFGSIIGAGKTGKVRRCICRSSGQEVACKIMPDGPNAHAEFIALRVLNYGEGHPGILNYLDGRLPESRHPLRCKYAHVITELCNGGDLRRKVKPGEFLAEVEVAKIIKSLVESLQFCHARRVVHRDVKLSSILISNDAEYNSWSTKLGNFDRAIHVKRGQCFLCDNVGTVGYSAPEMRSPGRGYSYEVDIWSAGVLLYVLLCGRLPFNHAEDEGATYEQIVLRDTKPDVTLGQWSSVSDSAKDLVLGMLQKRIWNRLSCDQILSHPWILSNTEIVSASTTSGMVAAQNTSTSKIDTTAAPSSESSKEELGTFRETVAWLYHHLAPCA